MLRSSIAAVALALVVTQTPVAGASNAPEFATGAVYSTAEHGPWMSCTGFFRNARPGLRSRTPPRITTSSQASAPTI